ncbi:hypothetical protein ZWY2020_000887 [Hordeum vulgare]|nr:hypothetical protein ZWY2020_000887 [Hordeum vulgare]
MLTILVLLNPLIYISLSSPPRLLLISTTPPPPLLPAPPSQPTRSHRRAASPRSAARPPPSSYTRGRGDETAACGVAAAFPPKNNPSFQMIQRW